MNKFLKTAAAAVTGAAVIAAGAFAVYAEDVTIDAEMETSNGHWGQSVKYYTAMCKDYPDNFDPRRLTEDSVVQIAYECELDDEENHIELIWQTWSEGEERKTQPAGDWNKVEPSSFSKGYSEFSYANIVAGYGIDDFSEVYGICVGDMGTPITVTSFVITNVLPADELAAPEEETEEEPAEEAEAETEAEAEEETEAETEPETEAETEKETEAVTEKETEAETTVKETEKQTEAETMPVPEPVQDTGLDSGGVVLIVIIVIVAAAIGVMIFLMKRKGPVKSDDWKR